MSWKCFKCGAEVTSCIVDGYQIGGRLLEDVPILVTERGEGNLDFRFDPEYDAYTIKLNNEYWMKLARKEFPKTDIVAIACPTQGCDGDEAENTYMPSE